MQNLLNQNFSLVLSNELSGRDSYMRANKMKVTAGGRSKEITAQQDILGFFAAKSQQYDAAINIDKALPFFLLQFH